MTGNSFYFDVNKTKSEKYIEVSDYTSVLAITVILEYTKVQN